MQRSNYSSYNVDMVFCIDATGSMNELINMVKKNALNLYEDLMEKMGEKGKCADEVRVKVVVYRDYIADNEKAMLVTDFFTLPDDNLEFEKCVNSIRATGGGDEPEDGLEALAYAIRSKWNNSTSKKRQVIVLWTDASTHELGFGKSSKYYASNMAKDFMELSEWWGDSQLPSEYIDQEAKRLILFAPDTVEVKGEEIETAWNAISNNWDNVIHFPSSAGQGLEDIDYMTIIDTICNSI